MTLKNACTILFAGLMCTLALASPALAAEPSRTIDIAVQHPTRHWLAAGTNALLPVEPGEGLADIKGGSLGWFEFEFNVEAAGWYRLIADTASDISRTEFRLDHATSDIRLTGAAQIGAGQVQVGWIWLSSGSHDLRVQQFYWTGFPQISKMRFEMPADRDSRAFRVLEMPKTSFEVDKCSPLRIETGGNSAAFSIDVTFRKRSGEVRRESVEIDASAGLATHSVPLWCDAAGDASVELKSRGSQPGLHHEARLAYSVFSTAPSAASFSKGRLIAEIDASQRSPDYFSGSTEVVSGSSGAYRMSAGQGATPFARRFGSPPTPSWFAYRLEGLVVGRPYIVECEYPDDAPRMFVLGVRDRNTSGYTASVAIETGGVWPLSGQVAARRLVVWPSDQAARVVVVNVHDGMKAAVAKIRVFEALDAGGDRQPLPAMNRDFLIWNEEGGNYRSTVGEPQDIGLTFEATDRYLRLASASGATVFSPTAVVYNFAMYPSRFNLTFSERGRDDILPFLLAAGRYGLKIVPQLHPRADEILWQSRDIADLHQRLLLSGKGERRLLRPDGSIERPPYYNALDPVVRDWYLNMVAELATRYKDHGAFAGIDLRFSFWQNAGLNNLVSLDWGYDATTVRTFYRETGIASPRRIDLVNDTREAAEARRNDLVLRHKRAWIRWRCQKIHDIYQAIVQRVRSIRPDLKIYVSFFALTFDQQPSLETMREAGIDVDLLKTIDGLTLIDARHQYGARESDDSWRRRNAAEFARPAEFEPFRKGDDGPHVLMPMQYIEFPASAVPASDLGLTDPLAQPYTSAASEPPGRLSLWRFASVLAMTDAFMLGDGGNGYVFGDEARAEFVREFRLLPKLRFQRLSKSPDAVVVRQRDSAFYIVNVRPDAVSVTLSIKQADAVVRASTLETINLTEGGLKLAMRPSELMVFRLPPGAAVESATLVPTP